ncbi:MAG: hypothetical protein ACOCVR_00145 [Myxococcota bacterium]
MRSKFLVLLVLAAAGCATPPSPTPARHGTPSPEDSSARAGRNTRSSHAENGPGHAAASASEVTVGKAAAEDVFSTVTFRRTGTEPTWTTLGELPRRLVWEGSDDRGHELLVCERPDGSRRLAVVGRSVQGEQRTTGHVMDYPSLEPVSGHAVSQLTGFDCLMYEVRVRDGRLWIRSEETGEDTWLDEHVSDLPGGTPEVVFKAATEAVVRWPGGEQGVVDLARNRIDWNQEVLPEQPERSRPVPGSLRVRDAGGNVYEIPPFEQCLPLSADGDRAIFSCRNSADAHVSVLWDSRARELIELDPKPRSDPERIEEDPFALSITRWGYVWDEEKLRYLRQADGPLRWFDDRAAHRGASSRVRDGVHEVAGAEDETGGAVEVRRYDLDAGTYRVVDSFEAGACPGNIGAGPTEYQEGAGRYLSVACLAPLASDGRHAELMWSQIFDLERGTTWRTPLQVRKVLADGTVFVTDTNRFDMWSSFRRVWAVQLPATSP